MKNLKLINLLLIVATSLLLVNCTTDPIYPEGPSGVDGVDGIDGTNGKDGATGTTECATCHNVGKSEAVHASYLFSGHAAGGAVGYAGSRASCAKCHSNEGYVDYVTTGVTTDYENPTAISCKTCHDTHTTFDFENEGYDYALRSIGPVQLIADASYTIDYKGTSNNCAQCHQPRRSPPTADEDGNFAVTSSHWGPHHGPQSTLLEGIQGAEIAGTLEYPSVGSASHRTGSSCTSCHMGATSGETDGEHTWIPTSTACTECHTAGIPNDGKGATGIVEGMETLHQLLEEAGILNGGHPHEGTYPIVVAEGAWNYLLLLEDASKGTHNPKYAKALLNNSIEALSAD